MTLSFCLAGLFAVAVGPSLPPYPPGKKSNQQGQQASSFSPFPPLRKHSPRSPLMHTPKLCKFILPPISFLFAVRCSFGVIFFSISLPGGRASMWPSPISRREIEIRAVVCPSISREYHTLSLFFCGSRFDKGETCPATASGGHGSQSPLMSPPLFEIAYGRNSSTIKKKGGFSFKKREKMAKKYSPEAISFPYIQFKHWGKKVGKKDCGHSVFLVGGDQRKTEIG